MEKINCSCGSAKEQVINAEKNVRVGWYCPSCRAFTKAIGRERKWRDKGFKHLSWKVDDRHCSCEPEEEENR